jgi:dTDP-glucose 4,6-dehydratase
LNREFKVSEERVVVTGGAGFIGSNLVHYLREERPEWRIHVVDALTYAGNVEYIESALEEDRITFEELDIAEEDRVESMFSAFDPTGVFHLAAESHVDRSIEGPRPFVMSNIVGTFNLLEAARLHWLPEQAERRFLNVSTDEVYGDLALDDPAFTEETPYNPSSPYSASKASADHLVRAYQRTFGLDTVITNCSNNFGPYQYPEKLIPVIIRNLRERNELPVYGDGTNVRDWLFVTDHCAAMLAAYDRGKTGESYNIGTQNEWQNIDLVRLLCDVYDELSGNTVGDSQQLISFVEDRPGHDRRYAIDPTKTREQLGWSPQYEFRQAITETVKWYLDNTELLHSIDASWK